MIVSRIAVCLPRDRTLDDLSETSDGQLVPGGRWLANPITARLRDIGAVIVFQDATHYWSFEVAYERKRFRIVITHTFPYACTVFQRTRLSLLDRVLRRDHREISDALFSAICEPLRAERRAGPIRAWSGSSRVRDEQRFIVTAVRELSHGHPLPGVTRVDRRLDN